MDGKKPQKPEQGVMDWATLSLLDPVVDWFNSIGQASAAENQAIGSGVQRNMDKDKAKAFQRGFNGGD